jgi:glycosyltransferase involved in cell wall biosynthesis
MNKNNLPLVSIIIPVYNSVSYVWQAVESVFGQKYPCDRMEIIVVDDGSNDGTGDILKQYEGKIFYIWQDNKGIASARNRGIAAAKGEVITFLDADDVWHEDRLRKIVGIFEADAEAGMVYHSVELIDRDGIIIYKNFHRAFGYEEDGRGWIANKIFQGRIFCGGSSFTFRRSVIDQVFPIPEEIRRGVDYYITAVASCIAPAAYLHEILGQYRAHDGNITMFAGHDDVSKLATVNKNFADMRQKVLDKISTTKVVQTGAVDLRILRRRWAKELIFYHFLTGERFKGARRIPELFEGSPSVKEFLRGIAVSGIILLTPASVLPKLLKTRERIRF